MAVLEIGDAGTEDEVRRTLDVAVQEIVPLDAALLAKAPVGIDGVLVADEAAAVEEQEVAVGEHRHGLADLLALPRRVLEGDVLEGHVAGVDVDAGAAGSAHLEVVVRPQLLRIPVVGEDGLVRALAHDLHPELGVRDVDGLLVGAGLDEDGGDLAVAVVRDGVDALLDGHVVAVAGLVHDDVVPHKMLAEGGNLLLEGVADDLRHLARPAGDRMGVVVLAGGDHEIGLGSLVADALEPVQSRRGDVQERHAHLLGHLLHRGGIVGVAVAVQLAAFEPAAGHRGEEDRRRAFLAGSADEGPEVLLVGAEGGRIAVGIVGLGIIVAELDEHVVPGLEGVLDHVPEALVDEALRAAAVLRVVDDVEGAVHEIREHHAPAALGLPVGQVLVRHRGIAHQVDGREGTGHEPDTEEEADSSTSSE